MTQLTPTDYADFAEKYSAGFSRTVTFLRSRGIQSDAEELAQAAWVRAWERRSQIRNPERWLLWVNSIALNLFREQHRRNKHFQVMNEVVAPPRNLDAVIDVARLLSVCSTADRITLQTRYLQGYSSIEAASRSGCSNTALRLRLTRAIARLRSSLCAAPCGLPAENR